MIAIELLEFASNTGVPNVRHASTLESQWLQKLMETYGEDYDRMMWDKELNPMQHTQAQLKRKIMKWKDSTQTASVL